MSQAGAIEGASVSLLTPFSIDLGSKKSIWENRRAWEANFLRILVVDAYFGEDMGVGCCSSHFKWESTQWRCLAECGGGSRFLPGGAAVVLRPGSPVPVWLGLDLFLWSMLA